MCRCSFTETVYWKHMTCENNKTIIFKYFMHLTSFVVAILVKFYCFTSPYLDPTLRPNWWFQSWPPEIFSIADGPYYEWYFARFEFEMSSGGILYIATVLWLSLWWIHLIGGFSAQRGHKCWRVSHRNLSSWDDKNMKGLFVLQHWSLLTLTHLWWRLSAALNPLKIVPEMSHCICYLIYWKQKVVMVTTISSLAAPVVVSMATSNAACYLYNKVSV